MLDLNSLSLAELYTHFARTGLVRRLIEIARDEDLGPAGGFGGAWGTLSGDVTGASCPFDGRERLALLRARSPGVACGLAVVPEILSLVSPGCRFAPSKRDGTEMRAGETIGEIVGPIRQVLAAERMILNLVGRLSGVSTRTRRFLSAMGGEFASTATRLYDTRKTTPGLRVLEKYAVRCGGGCCHRVGLFDAALIKDNHIAHLKLEDLPEFIRSAAEAARRQTGGLLSFVEVEVDSLAQLDAVMTLEPGVVDVVLLDNMGAEALTQAVAIRDRRGPRPELEASGGITLETIAQVARTGVDRISVGSLTHGSASIDVGLDLQP
ncbi:MAG: carboxylating nicotinate-nucleotide diphosphorylase [Phycisphaeraceae bacterium]|nr:carboxylating nicotinate-nucleotide diphosphorylase [Phycisphaerae bacterium]MBX3393351.1 carboxylating nicotinate-nucleotide diphosphorylase [Phycisphaeraceae bacterium]HRJ49787.1 carboxylating nicotinate-nucleotide diphosphorylase [Phycisphaerales bacterium]